MVESSWPAATGIADGAGIEVSEGNFYTTTAGAVQLPHEQPAPELRNLARALARAALRRHLAQGGAA